MGDENNDGRPRPEWERQFERHRGDAFAHQPMISRIMQENVTLRERFENRLTDLEQSMPDKGNDRIGALERFRAQATLVGGLALLALGAMGYAVASKLIH